MQSVFKFPISTWLYCQKLTKAGFALKQKITVTKADLPPGNTWSPIREKYPEGAKQFTLGEILYPTQSHKAITTAGDILLSRLIGGTENRIR